MFKRYDDAASHWGVFIPISRRKWLTVYRPDIDVFVDGVYRMHLCVTVKSTDLKILREVRVRIGKQYLPA